MTVFEEIIPELLELDDLNKLKTRLRDIYSESQKEKLKAKIKKASIPEIKLLDDFNFFFQPAIKAKVMELAKGSFINNSENIVILGATGLGKTHIAIALAIEAALKKGKNVKFVDASDFFTQVESKKDLEKKINSLIKPDLLILDDIGLKKIEGRKAAEILHRIITKRHGKKSTIFTSNVTPNFWLEEKMIAFPILDRIFEKIHSLKFEGESYRTGGKK